METKLKEKKVHFGRGCPRPKEEKELAVRLLGEGISFRSIARTIGTSHQSVIKWLKDHAETLPEVALEGNCETVEVDELCTFVKKK